jgi:hypothetical protein
MGRIEKGGKWREMAAVVYFSFPTDRGEWQLIGGPKLQLWSYHTDAWPGEKWLGIPEMTKGA